MRSPVAALTWEFWRRHRLGLAGVGAMVIGFATICALGLYESQHGAALHSMWFVMGLAYVIGVFAYGFDGRLEAVESGFPARLFLLPVRTWVLVGWPMLQGMATAVLMWVLWDGLVLRPSGIVVPRWWTPMLAAVVAVSQALVWRAFPLPWLRLAVAAAVLSYLVRIEPLLRLLGVHFPDQQAENTTLSLVAVAVIATAYLAAWSGVAGVRHGAEASWRGVLPVSARSREWRERRPFASALSAQVWYEWRRRGLGYVMTATFFNGIIMLGAIVFERSPGAAADYASIFLILPSLIAGLWGAYMGAGDSVKSMFELAPFTSTRPLSNLALVTAKLKTAAVAASATWAIALVTTAGWLAFTDHFALVSRIWQYGAEHLGRDRTVVLFAVMAIGPVLVIWRLLVINLWVGLMGRSWVSYVQMFLATLIGANALVGFMWLRANPGQMDRFLDLLPWLAGSAIALKAAMAGWLLRVLIRRGELTRTTARRAVVIWMVVAATMSAMASWLSAGSSVPLYGMAFGIVLALPFTRLALAPIALAWNRHR